MWFNAKCKHVDHHCFDIVAEKSDEFDSLLGTSRGILRSEHTASCVLGESHAQKRDLGILINTRRMHICDHLEAYLLLLNYFQRNKKK